MKGFTLIELMIVVSIIAILASVAIPSYQSALLSARIQKAKQDLRTLSMAITTHMSSTGELPEFLEDVGYGGKLDPWGNPYGYLNFESGTGNGMDWAIEQGLVDDSIFADADVSASVDAGGGGGGKGKGKGKGKAKGKAKGKGKVSFRKNGKRFKLAVATATPLMIKDKVKDVRRRDKALFPINSDFDLFSLGPNGTTEVSLAGKLSLDDVIRANDGQYFGVASEH